MLEIIIVGISSGVIGSIIIASIIGHFQRKNLEFNSLIRIFDLLADKDHREARKNVFDAFEIYVVGNKPDMKIFENIENDVEIVRSDFDQIGVLIYKSIDIEQVGEENQDKWFGGMLQKGYLPKEVFFEAYAGSVVNSWIALEQFIEYQRGRKFSKKRFMLFFNHLAKDAQRFHQERGKSKIQNLRETHSTKLNKWLEEIKNSQ